MNIKCMFILFYNVIISSNVIIREMLQLTSLLTIFLYTYRWKLVKLWKIHSCPSSHILKFRKQNYLDGPNN